MYTLLVAHQCLLASRPSWRDLLAPDTNTHTHWLTCPAGQVGQGFFEVVLVESDICEDVLFSDLRGLTTTHYPLGGGLSLGVWLPL